MSTEILQTNKNWLIWARKSAHFDKKTVANRANVSKEKLEKWEHTGQLTYPQLLKLSKIYQISPHLFFNGNDPVYEQDIYDFRSKNNKPVEISPKIIFELRNAKSKRQNLLDIEKENNDFIIPPFKLKDIKCKTETEAIEIIEDALNMNNAKRTERNLDYWIKCIEELGILVFQFYDISPEDLRGYVLYYDKLPIIGINHREIENARKFTLFHELVHLLYKKEGLSNLSEYKMNNNTEVKCNKIAAELIFPSDLLKKWIEDKPKEKCMDDSFIKQLSKRYKVSQEVIVRKYLLLNKISNEDYKDYKKQIDNYIFPQNKNKHEYTPKNIKNNEKKKKGSSQYSQRDATKTITKNGEYYINFLLYAYENDLISDIDFARYLNIPLNASYLIIKNMYERSQLL